MAGKSDPDHKRAFATRLAHLGRTPEEHHGFVNTPVYRGSTILYRDADALRNRDARYLYGRRGSPTMESLEVILADLDGADGCILSPSGLSAISTALLACVKAGDHVLMTDSVYRPARIFCNRLLKQMGVETEYYDPLIGAGIADLMRDNTAVVYTEAPGSQTMDMQDIPAIAKAAHDGGALVLMDNTWATPLFFQPLKAGVDVSITAGTKYFTGHSDAMLGTISASGKVLERLRDTHNTLGLCAGTEEIYLGTRGVRTLQVRLQRHMESGLEMARWLAARPEVAKVLHPGLEGCPGHDIWKRDFTGASGLFSVVLHPVGEAGLDAFLDSVKLFGLGFSWGGYESLVITFDPSSYRSATSWNEPGPALRFHIGLEDVGDLKEDLDRAFAAMHAAG